MTDLAMAALEAGATQLGEDGPVGAHFIFSREQLERFARAVGEPREGQKIPPLPY